MPTERPDSVGRLNRRLNQRLTVACGNIFGVTLRIEEAKQRSHHIQPAGSGLSSRRQGTVRTLDFSHDRAQQVLRPSRPSWEGHGVVAHAKNLDAAATGDAQGIWLGSDDGNSRAVCFYERHGFATVGVKAFQLGGGIENEFVMERAVIRSS